jgi:hypothetical protein
MQAPTFGDFGNSVDDAVRTEFFAFFHLVEEGRAAVEDGRLLVHFRPSGQFRDLVGCDISADADGRTESIALRIDRSFIENPSTDSFARDIARSFIGGGLVYRSDVDAVAEVIRDLRHRPQAGTQSFEISKDAPDEESLAATLRAAVDRGEQIVVTRRAPDDDVPVDLPEVISRGFAVYQGERDAFARDLANTHFSMNNLSAEGRDLLQLAFRRR